MFKGTCDNFLLFGLQWLPVTFTLRYIVRLFFFFRRSSATRRQTLRNIRHELRIFRIAFDVTQIHQHFTSRYNLQVVNEMSFTFSVNILTSNFHDDKAVPRRGTNIQSHVAVLCSMKPMNPKNAAGSSIGK